MGCQVQDIARLSPSGVLDTGVGTLVPGILQYPLAGYPGFPELAGLLVIPDGRVLLGYRAHGAAPGIPASGPALVTVGADGTPTRAPLPVRFSPQVVSREGGMTGISGRSVVRLRPDLTLDARFGLAGVARMPAGVSVTSVAQAGGTIRAAARTRRGIALVTLTPAGRVARVTRFAVAGWAGYSTVDQVNTRRDGSTLMVVARIGRRTARSPSTDGWS